MKISCIIASYNEAPRIGAVIEAVSSCSLVNEITVVDDGSTDNTASVMQSYPHVRYIRLPTNQGKSRAVYEGIKISAGEIILLIDADLMGLTAENISDLLNPVIAGSVTMTISLGNTYPIKDHLSQTLGIDHLSGERAFHRSLIAPHLEEIARLPGFGLETFINTLIVKNKYPIRIVRWKNVVCPLGSYKYDTFNIVADVNRYIRMWKAVFKVATPLEVFRNIRIMRGLRK